MENKPFKNVITDKKLKEKVGDAVLAYLANQKLIDMNKDLNHLLIEFGYLFETEDSDIVTLVKVKTAKGLFKKEKVFFLALQQGKMMLLDGRMFDEGMFRKTSEDMLNMHKVDTDSLDKKDCFMELY